VRLLPGIGSPMILVGAVGEAAARHWFAYDILPSEETERCGSSVFCG
jgi:hypothetical protein